MNALIVYCHPCPESFTAAVRDVVVKTLESAGHAVSQIDLYAEGFNPVMGPEERRGYHDEGPNLLPIESHAERLLWAETVIFVYPTWWYGLPAMLKGWLERVLVPGFAFRMPDEKHGSRPNLLQIRRVVALTTGGATPFISWIMGQPGRRTLLRGFRSVCHPRCRTNFMALYKMDTVSAEARRDHLARVARKIGAIAR
jgi:putative NADPH-quinone reductase